MAMAMAIAMAYRPFPSQVRLYPFRIQSSRPVREPAGVQRKALNAVCRAPCGCACTLLGYNRHDRCESGAVGVRAGRPAQDDARRARCAPCGRCGCACILKGYNREDRRERPVAAGARAGRRAQAPPPMLRIGAAGAGRFCSSRLASLSSIATFPHNFPRPDGNGRKQIGGGMFMHRRPGSRLTRSAASITIAESVILRCL